MHLGGEGDFAKALAALDGRYCCSGALALAPDRPLELVLPDGARAKLSSGSKKDQGSFVDLLLAHSEPAPFGEGKKTRTNKAVRNALRVMGRGEIKVLGFNPHAAGIVEAIERELSPDEHLTAALTDVILYGEGGHFLRHKDTPRDGAMIGTLVVGLPVAHTGGALGLRHGAIGASFEWGASPFGTLPWVAFYGEVDHEVRKVTLGHRVTLTYSLTMSGKSRVSEEREAVAAFRRSVEALHAEGALLPAEGSLFVPCAHRVIVPLPDDGRRSTTQTLALRGRDREVASALRSLGLTVTVRPSLSFANEPSEEARQRAPLKYADTMVTLVRPMPPDANIDLDAPITLAKTADDDEGPIDELFSLAPYISGEIASDACAARPGVYADLLGHAELFSASGYFGNECSEQWIYAFAVLEVKDPRPSKRTKQGAAEVAPGPRVTHKKFGEGELLSGDLGSPDAQLEIRFSDGVVRKILARFVTPA